MSAESRKRIEVRAAELIAEHHSSADPHDTGVRPDDALPPDRPRNTT